MAGQTQSSKEGWLSPALKSLLSIGSGAELREYSLLIYIGIFVALNLGNVTMLSSSAWTVYEPYDPSPQDDAVINDNSPIISAHYWDEDADPGTLRFYDNSDNLIGSCGVSNGSSCGVEWSGASAHDNDWYAVAEDDEGDSVEGPPWYFLINNPPNQVSSEDNPADGSTVYDDSVDMEVMVSDPDGDSMNVEFLNNISNASESGRIDYDVSDGGQASVNMDLQRGETYKWWVKVYDNWDTTKSGSWTFYVNELPQLTNVQPFDGAVHTDDEVILNATANDREQSSVTAYFYDDDDNFLGKDSGQDGDKLSSDSWDALALGNSYSWKLNVSDGYENATYQTFSFITSSTEEYRVEQRVNIDYSSLITSPESTRVFSIEVENKVSTPKDMRTYLEGVNAEFNENGQSSIDYELDSYETRQFLVTLRPETSDENGILRVISENRRIGINTTENIPVTVRKAPQVTETRSVPGITFLQVVAVMLLSVLLYYPRL